MSTADALAIVGLDPNAAAETIQKTDYASIIYDLVMVLSEAHHDWKKRVSPETLAWWNMYGAWVERDIAQRASNKLTAAERAAFVRRRR